LNSDGEEDDTEYDLYSAYFSPGSNEARDEKKLTTFHLKVKPRSLGFFLFGGEHVLLMKVEDINKVLSHYKKVWGDSWCQVTLPKEGVRDDIAGKTYVLEKVLGQGQDGTVLKMLPKDKEGYPLVLKIWKDGEKLFKFEDADDTWKINNEIKMREGSNDLRDGTVIKPPIMNSSGQDLWLYGYKPLL
jgi:hypothetical protein